MIYFVFYLTEPTPDHVQYKQEQPLDLSTKGFLLVVMKTT